MDRRRRNKNEEQGKEGGAVTVSQLWEVQTRRNRAVSPCGDHCPSVRDTRGRPQSNTRSAEHDLASWAGKEGRRTELVRIDWITLSQKHGAWGWKKKVTSSGLGQVYTLFHDYSTRIRLVTLIVPEYDTATHGICERMESSRDTLGVWNEVNWVCFVWSKSNDGWKKYSDACWGLEERKILELIHVH